MSDKKANEEVVEPPVQQEQVFTLALTANEVNTVLAALQELPHRLVDPILKKIVEQAQQQSTSQ
jgi:hypothetical protein